MKQYLKKKILYYLDLLVGKINQRIDLLERDLDHKTRNQQVSQLLLSQHYQSLLKKQFKLPNFEDIAFRVYSQNGEDGILLYIFSLIGATNRKAVEICAGNGIQCNTANLIINHGWTALLFDGDEQNITQGQQFYSKHPDTRVWPPKLVQAWITKDNINPLITEQGFAGEIDLLSLDMDGVDYWIWKSIDCIRPRVVVLEYQDIWGWEKAVTVPYKEDFVAEFGEFGPDYCGASLSAFIKLGKEKDYRLVGCNRYGFNAFFIRNDVGNEILPEIPASQCFNHPKVQHGIKHRLPNVIDRKWIEV